jgi:hypothetical protein
MRGTRHQWVQDSARKQSTIQLRDSAPINGTLEIPISSLAPNEDEPPDPGQDEGNAG